MHFDGNTARARVTAVQTATGGRVDIRIVSDEAGHHVTIETRAATLADEARRILDEVRRELLADGFGAEDFTFSFDAPSEQADEDGSDEGADGGSGAEGDPRPGDERSAGRGTAPDLAAPAGSRLHLIA